MAVIVWNEGMSVGVPLLDRDHQTLIGLINLLETHTADSIGAGGTVDQVLASLLAYTRFHFGREERVMEACGYPLFDAHRDEHRALGQEVRQLCHRFRGGKDGVTVSYMIMFLKDWLSHHILLHDMAYRPYAEDHPEAGDAAAGSGDFDFARVMPALASSMNDLRRTGS